MFFCYWQNSCSLTTVPISAHSEGQPRDTLIKSISQCLHVKTKLARTCMFSMRLLKQVLSFALDFFLIYVKMTLIQFLAEIYFLFQITVNPSDLSKMFFKKQIKYFDVPLEHEWKVPVSQELLNTRMNNLYVEGFEDYVTTEMINMLCNE